MTEHLAGLSESIEFFRFQMPEEVNHEMDKMNIKNNRRLRVVRIKKVKHQVGCLTNENPHR